MGRSLMDLKKTNKNCCELYSIVDGRGNIIILKLLFKLAYESITVSFLETIRQLLFLLFNCKNVYIYNLGGMSIMCPSTFSVLLLILQGKFKGNLKMYLDFLFLF